MNEPGCAAELFARVAISFAPYADDIVFIGGWVHALYLAEANDVRGAVRTDDIDVTIPPRLLTDGRPSLIELAGRAGFEVDPLSKLDDAPVRLVHEEAHGGSLVDLDILTEAADPRRPVRIEGQPELAAQGYPDQRILLENARSIEIGEDIHPLLSPPRRIRIPTLSAYVLQKAIASTTRTIPAKKVKDLVYLYEVLRHPRLGQDARAGMPALAVRYPESYAQWRARLDEVAVSDVLRRDMARQLLVAGRAAGSEGDVMASIAAQLRRALAVG